MSSASKKRARASDAEAEANAPAPPAPATSTTTSTTTTGGTSTSTSTTTLRVVEDADIPSSWDRPEKPDPEDGEHLGYDFDSPGLAVSLENVLAATKRIEGRVVLTPCEKSAKLSKLFGGEIYLKKDMLQSTGAFKERGALNSLLQLTRDQRKVGVIAASAGNHALGLTYHAVRLGIPVHVVMPLMAPLTKVNNCKELGAHVIQSGANFDEATTYARALGAEKGYTYIHGFDHPPVIAGQGSLGMEILSQVPDADIVVVPVGGGGLIAGLSMAVKGHRPQCQIIGVEPRAYRCLIAGLEAGEPVVINTTKSTIADGLAVKKVGPNCLPIARRFVDRVVSVSEHDIALGILRLIELEKVIVEGAGGAALAALLDGQIDVRGKKVVLCLCGGNIDVNLLGRIIEHGLAADGRMICLRGIVQDRPGGLASFTEAIASTGASTISVIHDRATVSDDFGHVSVQVTLETRDHAHVQLVLAKLQEKGFSPVLENFSKKQ